MKSPMLFWIYSFSNFDITDKLRDVLYDLIQLFGYFPILLHNVTEQVSPVIKWRLAEGREAEYLRLIKWELLVKENFK